MTDENYLPAMRAQYEELPYPERNPLDEMKRILMPFFDGIDRINHICHSGRKDFTAAGSRILIAGGGTGDSTIFLAEQLRDTDCEIVYLDISQASMDIARERASIRGLDNITWIHDSILNLPSLDIGRFDHISCSGVLMILEDPDEGLRALESVLADDGSMLIMVYARYGRIVVYLLQELLRLINHDVPDSGSRIRNCRTLLESFHTQHWFQYVKNLYINQRDIELYDLFLIAQDRPYSIPELYDFVEGAGLRIVRLLYEDQGLGSLLYEPRMYLHDEQMLESIDRLPQRGQHAVAELLNGRIDKHTLYVSRNIRPQPAPSMLDFIPSLPVTTTTVMADYQGAHQAVATSRDIAVIEVGAFKTNITIKKTPHVEAFFRHLDGRKTLQEIYDIIIATNRGTPLDYGMLGAEFEGLFAGMRKCDYLLMRHKSVPAYRTAEEIQQRMAY